MIGSIENVIAALNAADVRYKSAVKRPRDTEDIEALRAIERKQSAPRGGQRD